MIATQGKTSLTSEQVRELIPNLLFCKDCEHYTPNYYDDGTAYCNQCGGAVCENDFCSRGMPKHHVTWLDVKRWIEALPKEQWNLTAYVNLVDTGKWDGYHEITGLTPFVANHPVSMYNELSFDIQM